MDLAARRVVAEPQQGVNPFLEGPGTVVAVEVLVELVGVALELNLVLVVVKEQCADVGEAVRKDECPNDHADSGHKALEGRLRDDIAVADRGHGGERPVQESIEFYTKDFRSGKTKFKKDRQGD